VGGERSERGCDDDGGGDDDDDEGQEDDDNERGFEHRYVAEWISDAIRGDVRSTSHTP
jgi:hypothetical protein